MSTTLRSNIFITTVQQEAEARLSDLGHGNLGVMPNLVNAKLHSLFGIGTGRNVPEEHVESVVDAVVEELVGDDDDNEGVNNESSTESEYIEQIKKCTSLEKLIEFTTYDPPEIYTWLRGVWTNCLMPVVRAELSQWTGSKKLDFGTIARNNTYEKKRARIQRGVQESFRNELAKLVGGDDHVPDDAGRVSDEFYTARIQELISHAD